MCTFYWVQMGLIILKINDVGEFMSSAGEHNLIIHKSTNC